MKIFVVSVMAFSPLVDTDDPRFETWVENTAALIPAASIEEAAELAKAFAVDKWKPSEGWYGHQAAIIKVTKGFYDAAFAAEEAGIIDSYDETPEEQVFQF